MRTLVRKSLTKWIILALLGFVVFTFGYFLGERQGELHRARDQGSIQFLEFSKFA